MLAHIAQTFFDTVFPPTEDMLLVRGLTPDTFRALAHSRTHEGVGSLLSFRDARVRACIHEAKFHHSKKAIELLGAVLAEYLSSLPQKPYVLIPIPLSAPRYRERGYNQVTEIIRAALPLISGTLTLNETTLIRERNTKPQTDLPKELRVANVADAFGVRDSTLLPNTHIILIDDVLTTGATMSAAKAALLPPSSTPITRLTLAH